MIPLVAEISLYGDTLSEMTLLSDCELTKSWIYSPQVFLSFGSVPTVYNFFSDPHVADHFFASFLGRLFSCTVAPTASVGRYL